MGTERKICKKETEEWLDRKAKDSGRERKEIQGFKEKGPIMYKALF